MSVVARSFRNLTNVVSSSRQLLQVASSSRTRTFFKSSSTAADSNDEIKLEIVKDGKRLAGSDFFEAVKSAYIKEEAELTDIPKNAFDVLLKEYDVLREESADNVDKYRRSLAETENVRRRGTKQTEDAKLFAIQGFCKDLLEVADILDLAVNSVKPEEFKNGNKQLTDLHSGIAMTNTVLLKTFAKHGLVPVNPDGEKFDPNVHEAVFQIPAAQCNKPVGHIGHVAKIGYSLKGRPIRAAQMSGDEMNNSDLKNRTFDVNDRYPSVDELPAAYYNNNEELPGQPLLMRGPGKVDVDQWIEDVSKCKYLTEEDAVSLCTLLVERLTKVPNIVSVQSPVTICGDIHGQFYDLLELFRTGGPLPSTKYIFMGDYVDRGYYSLETCTLLFCYLLRYPDQITLLRGNHESRKITMVYGFYDECISKYGHAIVYRAFCRVFDCLPIAAVVDEKAMCVHGGLSPEMKSFEHIVSLDRFREIPCEGALCDIMWSDPEEDQEQDWQKSLRGAGWLFNGNVVKNFCENNQLELICRSHQLVDEGHRYYFDERLCTIWSAPNYCYRCGNIASILRLEPDGERVFRNFNAVPEDERVKPPRAPAPYFL